MKDNNKPKLAKMINLVNNGNVLARDMHSAGLLKNGLTLDQCAEIAKANIVGGCSERVMESDDFWEDFTYTADELGYKLKY